MASEQKIEQAAIEYSKKIHKSSVMVTFQKYSAEDFIAGAKSEAAKEYWFEIFKQEKNGENNL